MPVEERASLQMCTRTPGRFADEDAFGNYLASIRNAQIAAALAKRVCGTVYGIALGRSWHPGLVLRVPKGRSRKPAGTSTNRRNNAS
jgi:hypothetical protein